MAANIKYNVKRAENLGEVHTHESVLTVLKHSLLIEIVRTYNRRSKLSLRKFCEKLIEKLKGKLMKVREERLEGVTDFDERHEIDLQY